MKEQSVQEPPLASAYAKVKVLHKGVRESDFGPVDGTIAGCFDESQINGIMRIENDAIDSLPLRVSRGQLT